MAVSIVAVRPGLFTYILQKDVPEGDIVAVFQPTGHGVIYYDNGLLRCVYLFCIASAVSDNAADMKLFSVKCCL